MCRMVDLPAPFGPSSPVTPPSSLKLMSLTATTLPYQRETLGTPTGPLARAPDVRARAVTGCAADPLGGRAGPRLGRAPAAVLRYRHSTAAIAMAARMTVRS